MGSFSPSCGLGISRVGLSRSRDWHVDRRHLIGARAELRRCGLGVQRRPGIVDRRYLNGARTELRQCGLGVQRRPGRASAVSISLQRVKEGPGVRAAKASAGIVALDAAGCCICLPGHSGTHFCLSDRQVSHRVTGRPTPTREAAFSTGAACPSTSDASLPAAALPPKDRRHPVVRPKASPEFCGECSARMASSNVSTIDASSADTFVS